jgi:hypothetical protein
MLYKLAPNTPSIAMSLAALVLAFMSFRYSKKKDSAARVQSIQDDFWLRKVLSPATIEPFVTLAAEIMRTLPTSENSTQQTVKSFQDANIEKLVGLHPAFGMLELLGQKVREDVDNGLDEFEDCLTTYTGKLFEHLGDPGLPLPSREQAKFDLSEIVRLLLSKIREHQANVAALA